MYGINWFDPPPSLTEFFRIKRSKFWKVLLTTSLPPLPFEISVNRKLLASSLMEEVVVELIEVREELVETAGGLLGAAVELGSKDGLVELRGDRGGLRDSRASSLSEGGRGTVEEEIVALKENTIFFL